ncbi:hypothetical protein ACFP7B_18565 [Sanguibacter inulinus]
MPGRRRTSRPLFVTVALGVLLVAGAPSALAAPAPVAERGAVSISPVGVAISSAAQTLAAAPTAAHMTALPADASPEPGVSPTGPTTPAAEDDDSEGTPWTGIVVGGGLGLLAGIGLMVLSKRRENRG